MDSKIFYSINRNHKDHWWFKARRDIFESIIKKTNIKKPYILDFGSGAGANLNLLKKFSKNIDAFEPNLKMQNLIKKKYNVNIAKKLGKKKYDLIFFTDVLEHIKADKRAMKKIFKILKNNGIIILTVPAYYFLYSKKDKALGHFRRYNIKTLTDVIPKNLKIEKISYFNFFLFFPLCSIIILNKIFGFNYSDLAENKPNKIINYLLYKIFSFEKFFFNYINFPFGISIIALLRKIK